MDPQRAAAVRAELEQTRQLQQAGAANLEAARGALEEIRGKKY